jgi:hypothetical protein
MGKIALHKLPRRLELKTKRDSKTGCWNWTGSKTTAGYGEIGFDGETHYVHRVSHIIYNGLIDEENPYICHTCDNPSCINPDHLFAGSHQDNIQDAADKGRVPTPQAAQSGEDHHSAKMTADKVVRLREMYASGEYTQTELANRFGIGAAQASSIIRGVYWEDAGGPIKD